MELKNQVCSLALAKKLKELGVKQESAFYWTDWCLLEAGKEPEKVIKLRHGSPNFDKCHYSYFWEQDLVSAFTVAELGEMLPRRLDHSTDELKAAGLHPPHMLHRLITEHQDTRFMLAYICADCKGKTAEVYADTEADARAKMLIYLIENKLITL